MNWPPHLVRGSLRLRLLVGALCWVSAALVAVGFILVHLFRTYAEDEIYTDLSSDQQEIVAHLTVDKDGRIGMGTTIGDAEFYRPKSGSYWQVDVGEGPPLRSQSLADFVLVAGDEVQRTGEERHRHLLGPDGQTLLATIRFAAVPGHPAPVRVIATENAITLDSALDRFSWSLVVSFMILGGGLIGAAALQVWIGLRPLVGLRTSLSRIRAGSSRRLQGRFPSEIQPLIDELNSLLDHQAGILERARLHAGNLAHGLKTPLAVVANEANRIGRMGATGAADIIQSQVLAMQRQVDYHTARARSAAARAVPGLRCPVRPSILALMRVIERLHPETDLAVHAEVPAAAVFRGESQDLEEMLGNLIDNAVKWATKRIVIFCLIESPSWLKIMVDDDGPGLPPEHRDDAIARGQRLDESVPGSGLGLAIVRDLVDMYGGEIALDASPLGGLRVILRLPGV